MAKRGRQIFVVSGVKEIDRAFKKLPQAVGKKVIRKAIRESLKPLLKQARNNAPQDTGALKKSIKIKAGAKRRRGRILLRVRPQTVVTHGKNSPAGKRKFYAKFQEEGWTTPSGTFVRGKHWLREAFQNNEDKVRASARKLIRIGIDEQLKILGRRSKGN